MAVPEWIWYAFIFAFGSCIGSFLNVVIYRIPREKSIVTPPSSCPDCGKLIRFYDNIPLLSWLVLGGKCRHCKMRISPRYFIIELLTGLIFLALFILYFKVGLIKGLVLFESGWLVYLIHIIMIAGFIACSAIDIEMMIIPISICWIITLVGIVGSGAAGYIIDISMIRGHFLMPYASAKTGALALGGAVGLIIALILLVTGLIKRSYNIPEEKIDADGGKSDASKDWDAGRFEQNSDHNDRREMLHEILFLLPVVVGSFGFYNLLCHGGKIGQWWIDVLQIPAVSGVLGSIWGYLVACALVWGIRIFGTFAFGREAMGLGDVHLLGAAGAIVGPVLVTVAFFIAPFAGLGWAVIQLIFKKTRQIPYGPFLSIGVLAVIILHDYIYEYIVSNFYM